MRDENTCPACKEPIEICDDCKRIVHQDESKHWTQGGLLCRECCGKRWGGGCQRKWMEDEITGSPV